MANVYFFSPVCVNTLLTISSIHAYCAKVLCSANRFKNNKIRVFISKQILVNGKCSVSITNIVGRDSSVGTATDYGLDGPGIESTEVSSLSKTQGNYMDIGPVCVLQTTNPTQTIPPRLQEFS
jgi:hypothetical protein